VTVAQILKQKGRTVVTAEPSQTLESIVGVLAVHRIGAVLIRDTAGRIAGIVSERDIVRALAEHGAAALHRTAAEVMTRNVHTCTPGDTEAGLMAEMTEHRIRHLPVVEAGKLVGIVSIGDVVKRRIETIEREAEEMKAYIATAG